MKDNKSYSNRYVTLGDGAKGNIIGKWKLDYPGLPFHNDVLLVDGLTTNLNRINQLYDHDLYVNFSIS